MHVVSVELPTVVTPDVIGKIPRLKYGVTWPDGVPNDVVSEIIDG